MITISPERKIELLTAFNENAELKHVLKEVLLRGIYGEGVIKEGEDNNSYRNWAINIAMDIDGSPSMDSNEQKGARLSAVAEGLRFLESSFKMIEENYKPKVASEGDDKNPAR